MCFTKIGKKSALYTPSMRLSILINALPLSRSLSPFPSREIRIQSNRRNTNSVAILPIFLQMEFQFGRVDRKKEYD
jgi:hypothetical protein